MVNLEPASEEPESFIQLRSKFLQELETSADIYENEDIERIRSDDAYCKRFLLHKKGNFDAAYEMLKEALAWRKSFGARTCTEDSIPAEFFEARAAFPYNQDKHGNPIILLLIRFHKKDAEYAKEMRRFVIHWVEKMEEESNGGQMTVIMNCLGAGISNLDLDLIKFLITLFRSYYPHSLAHILIYEMPWIFNTAWRIIKSWLPEDFVEKIVFVNKTTIQDFIDVDSLPLDMGGNCLLQYEPPKRQQDINSNSVNGTSVKRVHFSHNGYLGHEGSPLNSPIATRARPSHDKSHLLLTDDYCILAGILKISPAQNLVFFLSKEEVYEVSIKLTCISTSTITYKVKTNNIENYRVKPSIGIIEPNGSIDITVFLLQGKLPQTTDKFLIMAMVLPDSNISVQSLSSMWRTSSAEQTADHKLKCLIGIPDSEKPENKIEDALKNIALSVESLSNRVQSLQLNQEVSARRQNITLFLLTLFFLTFCCHLFFANYDNLMDLIHEFIFH